MADEQKKSGRPTKRETTEKLLAEIKERYAQAEEHESENRILAVEDLNFVYDEEGQWQEDIRRKRRGRPCFTYNRVLGAINQVIGDQRQNRIAIKVRAVDSKDDTDTANTMSGLIRNIESCSDAETCYDTAYKLAVAGGYGVVRVVADYSNDRSMDQEIYIRRVPNPFTVYFDPSAHDFCKRDMEWCLITERVSKATFERKYPGKATSSISVGRYETDWFSSDEIRIAEYYRAVYDDAEIALLSDGSTVDYDLEFRRIEDELASAGITVKRKRKVKRRSVEWVKVSGADVLEGPLTVPCKYIPVVPVYGRSVNIDGKEKYSGLTRFAKDPQRSYNYHRSAIVEICDSAPKSPWKATPAMVKGFEWMYEQANEKNFPVLHYNPDPLAPTLSPSREPPMQIPTALVALTQQDADDIKATTGYYDPSLGARSNETSGRAIIARQTEGDVGSFEFPDNLTKAVRMVGEILVDMIPQVYDTERQVRIINADDSEEFVTINQEVIDEETGQKVIVHDLSQGRYDVAVDTGPSYTTRRQEAAETMLGLLDIPIVQQTSADLAIKALDAPGADEIAKRIRLMLIKQGAVQPTEEDAKNLPQPQPPGPQEQLAMAAAQAEVADKTETARGKAIDNETKLAAAEGDIVHRQLENMILAGEIGIDATTGRAFLFRHEPKPQMPGNGQSRPPQ